MILVDLNVLLDVLQKREPHYRASAAVLERVVRREETGYLAAHSVTTAHYLVARYRTREKAEQVIDWLLQYFEIAPVDRKTVERARQFGWKDFEDAVVAAAARAAGCRVLVTRNVRDFDGSLVPALTPDEYFLHCGMESPDQIQDTTSDYRA